MLSLGSFKIGAILLVIIPFAMHFWCLCMQPVIDDPHMCLHSLKQIYSMLSHNFTRSYGVITRFSDASRF
jgi:hypothetical protein